MVNVLILTEGGAESGYGHMSRCLALVQAFNETKTEIDVKFIVRADKRAKALLKSNSVNFVNLDWVKRLDEIQKLIEEETIIIVDSYQAPSSFYKKLHEFKSQPYVVAIDDYNRICYEVDSIINVSVNNKHSVGYKKRKDVEYLVGDKYLPLRREFWKKPNKRINKKLKDVLISLGGTDQKKLVAKIINALGCYNFELHIISINNKSHTLFDRSKINMYSDLSAKDICSLMLKADLCISGGGQLLNELAYFGVPTIGICLALNQLENIKRWENTKFIEYIGWYHDKNLLKEITNAIDKFIPYDERVRRSKIGRRYIDGKGALRITTRVLQKSASRRGKP